MICPSHPSLLDHSNYFWREVQVMKLLFMQLPPISSSSLFGANILLSTLFSHTLSLCSSLNIRDQVPHPYRTTSKIIVLYNRHVYTIINFIIMYSNIFSIRRD
jgi:hypothetical protein